MLPKDELYDILSATLNLTDEFMYEHISRQILRNTKTKLFVTMNAWVEMFSLYLRGNLEEKMKYCFGVYDIMSKGFLGREIMFR